MKKIIILLSMLLYSFAISAQENCLLIKNGNDILIQEGDCSIRHEPRCSFNFALSLMTYNEDILIDETSPSFPFKQGYLDYVEKWKQPHNPTLWIQNSCIWYSHLLTAKLGMKKFQEYAETFNYGTRDVSGELGKNNGLTRAWMSGGSLKISAAEQTSFLQKIIDRKLPVKPKAYEMTKKIFFVEELANGWKLYGKTGSGNLAKLDGTLDDKREGGWFVGWIEKGDQTIVFAHYIEQDSKDIPAGRKAKAVVRERLVQMIKAESWKLSVDVPEKRT